MGITTLYGSKIKGEGNLSFQGQDLMNFFFALNLGTFMTKNYLCSLGVSHY